MTITFDQIVPQLTPDVQSETDWAGGLSTLPSLTKKLLLVGIELAAGTLAAGQVRQITNTADADAWWGEGSHLANMARVALKIAPKAPIYGVAYAEPSGTPATANIAITGTKATTSGTLTVYIGGRRHVIGVAVDDTPTEVGEALEAAIKATDNHVVTAENTTGTVAVTALQDGPEGNSIRMHGECTAEGLTLTVAAVLASGATPGDPTTVLAGVEADRYHLICIDSNDATALYPLLSAVVDHVELQSTPAVKKWCVGIAPNVGNLAGVTAMANALDSYRMQIVWQEESELPCWELAAAFAALRARVGDPRKSLDDMVLPDVPVQYDETKWPTAADIEAAQANGATPLRPMRNGDVQVVRSVITRHTAPVAFIDSNIVEISDYQDEYVIGQFSAKQKGKGLKTLSPAGTANVVTPKRSQALLYEALKKLDKDDFTQGADDDHKAGLIVAEANAQETNRMDLAYPFRPIYQAHQIMIKKTYTTP